MLSMLQFNCDVMPKSSFATANLIDCMSEIVQMNTYTGPSDFPLNLS